MQTKILTRASSSEPYNYIFSFALMAIHVANYVSTMPKNNEKNLAKMKAQFQVIKCMSNQNLPTSLRRHKKMAGLLILQIALKLTKLFWFTEMLMALDRHAMPTVP